SALHAFPTRRSSDLEAALQQIAQQHSDAASALASVGEQQASALAALDNALLAARAVDVRDAVSRALRRLTGQSGTKQDLSNLPRSEEHTSELQSPYD